MKLNIKNFILLFCLILLTHCGSGTQVLSPPNPGGSVPTALRTRIANYQLDATLPAGWTFQRLLAADPLPAGTYNDTNPATNLEAVFRRATNQFSFFSFLVDTAVPLDQGLARFIQQQNAATDFTVQRDLDNPIPAYAAVIVDSSSTANRIILEAYYAVEGLGFLLRLDVSGSSAEIEQVFTEFEQFLDSIDVNRPADYVENDAVDRLLISLCAAVQRCDNSLSAVTCLDEMDLEVGNQVWDEFGATWPENSVSSNEVRRRANARTVSIQSPAYENCLSEMNLLCSDSFRISAGTNYRNTENLISSTLTPSCGGAIRN